MDLDPVQTNPDNYRVLFENDRVRVLEYTDTPGVRTQPHEHPDSVVVTLSSYRRRIFQGGDQQRDVEATAGRASWLPSQRHAGENIGDTDSHAIFVELKDGTPRSDTGVLGPD